MVSQQVIVFRDSPSLCQRFFFKTTSAVDFTNNKKTSSSSRQGKAKNFTPKNQISEGIKYDVSSQPFYIIVIGWLVLHVGYLSLKSLDTGMSCRYWM